MKDSKVSFFLSLHTLLVPDTDKCNFLHKFNYNSCVICTIRYYKGTLEWLENWVAVSDLRPLSKLEKLPSVWQLCNSFTVVILTSVITFSIPLAFKRVRSNFEIP